MQAGLDYKISRNFLNQLNTKYLALNPKLEQMMRTAE